MSTRLNQIGAHLANADDVVIVYAKRTAMTRAKKGGFKDTNPEWLLATVLKDVLTSTKIDPSLIEDVLPFFPFIK
jgi:acetyl-CoA acyltransferase 1